MVQFLFTNKDMESLKGLYRIMTNGFVSVQESVLPPSVCPPSSLTVRLSCSESSKTLEGVSGLTAGRNSRTNIEQLQGSFICGC